MWEQTLKAEGMDVGVIDMYCIKSMDEEAVLMAAKTSKLLVTAEEHAPYGGLGSIVSQLLSKKHPKRVVQLSLPDGHIVAGTNKEIFHHYGLDAEGMAKRIKDEFKR